MVIGILHSSTFVYAMSCDVKVTPLICRQFRDILLCDDPARSDFVVKKQILEMPKIQKFVSQIRGIIMIPEFSAKNVRMYGILLSALQGLEAELSMLARKRWEVQDFIKQDQVVDGDDIGTLPVGVEIFIYPFGKIAENLLMKVVTFRKQVLCHFEGNCD